MALAVTDVLDAWAQEQRDSGNLKGGFRTLARESFVTVSHAQSPADTVRSFVSRAAELGVLDDLVIDPDGRRFTCRVSGWDSDSTRGRAALRQADKRNRDSEQGVTDGDVITSERDVSRDVTLGALEVEVEEKKEEREESAGASERAAAVMAVFAETPAIPASSAGIENAVRAYPNGDHVMAARTVRSWLTSGADFKVRNAGSLLMSALSKQKPAGVRDKTPAQVEDRFSKYDRAARRQEAA